MALSAPGKADTPDLWSKGALSGSECAQVIRKIDNRSLAILHDLIMIPIAWLGAYWLRFNMEAIPQPYLTGALQGLVVVTVFQAIAFRFFGLYRGIWRFASLPDLIRIIKAILVGAAFSAIVLFLATRMEGIPRSVFPLYGLLLVAALGGSRLLVRWSKDRRISGGSSKRVLVVGAGRAGEMLVRDLLRSRDEFYEVVGFVDDSRKQGREIHGVRVLGACEEITDFVERLHVDFIVLAIPSASSEQMRRLVGLCNRAGVPFRTVPPIEQLMSGELTLNQLREVSIADLLGREPVSLDWTAIKRGLRSKTVLVTGAGGSIGSELCRQIANLDPAEIVLVDHSEFNLYSIEHELRRHFRGLQITPSLTSVTDRPAIEKVIDSVRPSVIFHAAAYKQVPMLEEQIREAVQNNTLGTKQMADLADRYGCEVFVMISTDKAVNPANVMGASKRAAEIFCQNLDRHSRTKFITVRFGNVLGSAGSVVPLFSEQIKCGGPVTVTHREITRYFMTIHEASQLILQSGIMGRGGEIFVLDMGEPIKISDLAEQMIRLSGKVPREDIEIIYTGLRPGEKLFEELFHEREALHSTRHSKILLARYRKVDWRHLNEVMDEMQRACAELDETQLQMLMKELVPEWRGDVAEIEHPMVELQKMGKVVPLPGRPMSH
jgi:FlaA1/EpsC-like NDP-sugar epimerase